MSRSPAAHRRDPLWRGHLPQRTEPAVAGTLGAGALTYEQLAAWSARHPEQVPIVNGEFEWLIAFTPEACE